MGRRLGLRWSALLLAVAASAPLLLAWLWLPLSPAEVLWSFALAGLGAWLGAGGRAVLGRGGSLLLFLVVAEAGARARWQPWTGPVSDAWWVDPGEQTPLCTWASATRASQGTGTGPRVIHLGDSMIDGPGQPDTVIPLLQRADARVLHQEAGLSGTAPDCALLVLRDAPAADLVVLHLFLPNDLEGLIQGYVWCDQLPLFSVDGPLEPRCTGPSATMSASTRLALTPLPWALRQARRVSALAVGFGDAWESLRLDRRYRLDHARRKAEDPWPLLERLIVALREESAAHGARFGVVLVPIRPGLRGEDTLPVGPRVARAQELLARLDVPTIDATGWLAEQAAEGVDPATLHTAYQPMDPHLSAEGHRRYAAWLGPRLSAWVPGAEAP